MADQASVFTITARAQGFDQVSSAARKLTADFQMVGRAGTQMGRQVSQGLIQMHRHPHRGSHAPRPGARHPHHHHMGGAAAGAMATGGGGGGGGYGGGGAPPGGPPGGGMGPGGAYPSARGSFLQGLLQGTTGNMYIPRGPGMLSQTAGLTAGRMASGVAASTVLGPEALLGAVGSVPIVGGLLAGAFGQGISSGKQEIGYQGSMSNLMPYIDATRGGFTGRLDAQRDRLGGLGMRYGGMSAGQTLQTLAQAQEHAGGLLSEMGDERLQRILASQKGYGIDAGTGAVLARGEDLGALTGRGSAQSESTAIRGAERLGLKGSEIANYVRNIASHVQAFAQTGMKVDVKEESDAARMFQNLGGPTMTGQRAAFIGQGFESTASSIAENGPQDANQSALLMAAGWNPEDPQSYLQALRNLEDPTKRAKYQAQAEDEFMQSLTGMNKLQKGDALREYRKSTTHVTLSHAEADRIVAGRKDNPFAAQEALSQAQTESTGADPERQDAQGRSNVPLVQQYGVAGENRREEVGRQEAMDVAKSELNATIFASSKAARSVGDTLLKTGNVLTDAARDIHAVMMWKEGDATPKIH